MKPFRSCFRIGLLTAVVMTLVLAPAALAAPKVGISYLTWFNNAKPSGDCTGSGWADKPFGLENVRSLVFSPDPAGYCYSSMDPSTAKVHARSLEELGVDFVILDDTNLSKMAPPASNPIFQGTKAAVQGFSEYTGKPIQVTYELSLTCWAEQCHKGAKGDTREIFTYNENVRATIEEIASMYGSEPSRFIQIGGKPLLLFYLNKGSNVVNLNNTQAFNGPGNLIPTPAQFNPEITVAGKTRALREVFTVRYALAAYSNIDYGAYSSEIWPFTCKVEWCRTTEAGYAHLYSSSWGKRSLPEFRRMVDESTLKDFLVVDNWNGFSSTDEYMGAANTIEPNTQLHKVDSTPGNADPWYFYNGVKERLHRLHAYHLVARHSGKCMDLPGGSLEAGKKIQQWECNPAGTFNQFWSFIPTGLPYYQLINGASGKCLDVTRASISPGAKLQQYDCIGAAQANQLWRLVPTGGSHFLLVSKSSGLCADVEGVSTANGAALQQYNCISGQKNQEWGLVKLF